MMSFPDELNLTPNIMNSIINLFFYQREEQYHFTVAGKSKFTPISAANSHCTILVNNVDMDITNITATNHERQYRWNCGSHPNPIR